MVDLCRGKISPLTGRQVCVVAAGGIFDSRGLALALCCGADAVWVGTRFVVSKEAGAPPAHQKSSDGVWIRRHDQNCHLYRTSDACTQARDFNHRPSWIGRTIVRTKSGTQDRFDRIVRTKAFPIEHDINRIKSNELELPEGGMMGMRPWLMGQCAGALSDVQSAKEIIVFSVSGAIKILRGANRSITYSRL